MVDAAFHDLGELFLQQWLMYIVLILTDTDGLGVDLDQLGQRVVQSPSD